MLYAVWGRIGPGAWELQGVYANKHTARDAGNEALERLQEQADRLFDTFRFLPRFDGAVAAAEATRPPLDAEGKIAPWKVRQQIDGMEPFMKLREMLGLSIEVVT